MSEIDLHTHSTASDGTLTPSELVAAAVACHLRAVALTDHDTVSGLPEALAAGKKLGMEVIGGCELSAEYPQGNMHILGLWVPEYPAHIQKTLARLEAWRKERNLAILEKLNACGVPVTYEELLRVAGTGSVGRPHIARLLMEKGVVHSIQEAFSNWLRPGRKAYVPKVKLSPRQSIELLKEEKATAILAHPCTLHLDADALEILLRELKDYGLDGLEVIYSMHTQRQTATYAALADKLDLLHSAGSDFHGDNKPNIALGRGKGGLYASYDLVERMKARR